jgi:SAM-dependent methyltransferase
MSNAGGYDDYPFVAEFYDAVPPYRDRRDVAFFVEMARQAPGAVLEIGCGTGRVLIPTARAGVEITGLDASSHMLAVCREKLAQEPEEAQARVRLARADMRHFELRRRFELVTVPFRPFQHLLRVEDQLACLASIRRHLAPGGNLILDIFNPSLPHLAGQADFTEVIGEEPEFTMPDGRLVHRHHRFVSRDLFNQVQQVELIYEVRRPDGELERLVHRFSMRYLFRFEAEHLLARSGFAVEDVYADYDRSPYGSKNPGELIFLARRV